MGWVTTKTYTKECGCEYEDKEHDVDRPFMCYTEWNTTVTKRCEIHLQEYNEACAKLEKQEEREKQIKEERRQLITSHLHGLMHIEHKQYTPIKEAVNKYREVIRTSNSDRWIRGTINYAMGDVLMIQKIKNKWVCNKERLEYSDFNLILKLFNGWQIRQICQNLNKQIM